MAYLQAPDGSKIIGTLERIPGVANIQHDSFKLDADGKIDFQWQGGTDVDWDGQVTIFRRNPEWDKGRAPERVFVDEDGGEWLESELTLVDTLDA